MPQKLLSPKLLTNIRKLFFNILFFIFMIGNFYFFDSVFTIKKISIKFSNFSKIIGISGLEELKQKNILLINSKKAEERLSKRNPLIKKLIIKKIYPSQVELSIDIYAPYAQIEVSNGYFILSNDGRILKKIKKADSKFPTIKYYQKLNYFSFFPGDFLKYEDIKSGLYFLTFLKDLNLEVNDLDIADFDMLLFNVGDKKVIFTTLKNKEKQAIEIESILHQFKIEGKSWQSIDLRFDKPVIQF